jgi:hypothetical protein
VSKERQRRREERQARRDARRQVVTKYLPAAHSRPTGVLAEKRRREVLATGAVLVVLNILVFAVARDWALTALLVVASVLGAPILYLMMFRRA